jgi:alpha-mannosidase
MSLETGKPARPVDVTAGDGQAIVHLVPHTHWDREWYEPFQVFRMRLVDLIDQLLERMAADPRLRFTLDGQAATVDDYLEIRPQAEPLIRQLIAEGRLAIGPWQILLDEFLVSGETIVRNLELGWRRAEDLGGAMRVGYLPDMFGHVAQMPQLLRRAGIERAVVWRGVPSAIDRHTFTWQAPDGSWVETEYLVGGYGNGAYLFDVPSLLEARLDGYRVDHASFYGERSLLAMYGTDHAVPSPQLADLVERANAAHGPVKVELQTLSDYLERDGPHPNDDPTRAALSGELRSGARANMLMNVTSARVDLKHAAARAERRLERYAEPLAALHGDPDAWPERLLELAWRRVVDNSAHDSICGCSHDQVVAQVIGRYAEAHQIGSGIVTRVLDRLARQAPAGGWAIVNPSPVDREDLVDLDVAIPEDWESVALRLGDRWLPTQEEGRPDTAIAAHRVRGDAVVEFFHRRRHGRELFGRQINGLTIEGTGELPRILVRADDRPDPPELDVEGLLAEVGVAAAGRPEAIWAIDVRASERRRLLARIPVPALSVVHVGECDGVTAAIEPIEHPVVATDRGLGNGLVGIRVDEDGTLRLVGGGVELAGVGRIVDGGEAGDSYNYGPPGNDVLVDRPLDVEVRVERRGPLRGEIVVIRTYAWPRGLTPDARGRDPSTVPTTVRQHLEIRAGEPFVRVRIAFDNQSRDHRVRFHVPLPERVEGSASEGQFAVVDRGLTYEGGHGEVPLPTYPAHAFVSVDGCSILLDQVTEYEVVDGRELALTILRSFGLISRNANPYREDPAGPEIPVPAAQLLGEREFAFAILPHRGDWRAAETVRHAEAYRHPMLSVRGLGDVATRSGPADAAGLRVDGATLSALRRRDGWLELRLVRLDEDPAIARISLLGRGAMRLEAEGTDLLGRPGEAMAAENGEIAIALGGWEIRTLRLRTVAER